MQLYVVRHGEAEPSAAGGDSKRNLTEEGIDICRKVASSLKGKIKVESIYSSPLVRARQTAEIFAAQLGLSCAIGMSEELTPGSSISDTIGELHSLGNGNVMIVGHNPHLSNLTAALVSNGSLRFNMKKAAVLCIGFSGSVRAGSGDLRWAAVPKLLL